MKCLKPAGILGQNIDPALVLCLIFDGPILKLNTNSDDAKRWGLAVQLVLNSDLIDGVAPNRN